MEEVKNKFAVGENVNVKDFGRGKITKISPQESDNGMYSVYHVTFRNGETRHFVEEELKKGKEE